ncbi:MAG TPA: GH92 family glycosyl hydrolase [Prolixibacteraceae bacterium]|nr:GH92 family glycosyl hydrolase [Prolixibacteraceae bacterium]HOS00868.1 GH92 family glycosyl hydrolase [Prolixibacteraceae bacterium]HPL46030.1 GH92 family glycosyl hydrolase [Prolixibacteraceae bacterium]
MQKIRLSAAFFLLSALVACNRPDAGFHPVDYVDPFIGTDFHGHVFPGASVPYGAVQLGPVNFIKGWDWCSGYHYSDSILTGFSHLHLSGTGIGDLGDLHLMPYTGKLRLLPGRQEDISGGYASFYSHEGEKAFPGFYSVDLETYGIKAEVTASERVGFHRYTFPEGDTARIIIDLRQGIGWDMVTAAELKPNGDALLSGYRYSRGWAPDQRLWFALELSEKPDEIRLFSPDLSEITPGDTSKAMKGVLTFYPPVKKQIMIKAGISPVSEENARANIDGEIPGWDFGMVVSSARDKWNRELSRIEVKTRDTSQLRTFYTAMYHLMIHPSLFNDVNGDYRGSDKEVYRNASFQNYSVFSLWDTYRAAHPLYTLLDPQRVSDFVNSMLAIYEQQGSLPVWHLMGNETGTMVGNHSIPVIADAILKDIGTFDRDKAFEAMKNTALSDDGDGLKFVNSIGWVAADSVRESVSKGLEYAVDDWAVSRAAKALGKEEDYLLFKERAGYYRHYFDPAVGFFKGKNYDGSWSIPFHPVFTLHEQGNYTEGNAWQYLWMVPTDVEGLISLLGGDDRFINRLDSLFLISSELNEGASPDISGLIGQYAHGNEPSHHTVYLYAYAGRQWKSAEKVRYILEHLYHDTPDGICGNEDCGQMSAWYIFSSLGFYPVNPVNSAYVLGSPLHEEATLHLTNGKRFTVKALNNGPDRIYIRSARLNGSPWEKSYITHNDILRGGVLELEMGSTPNEDFGKNPRNRPVSEFR